MRATLLATVVGESAAKDVTVDEAAVILRAHPQIRAQLLEALPLLGKRISHASTVLGSHPDAPLRVPARYSATEILAAFGEGERAVGDRLIPRPNGEIPRAQIIPVHRSAADWATLADAV